MASSVRAFGIVASLLRGFIGGHAGHTYHDMILRFDVEHIIEDIHAMQGRDGEANFDDLRVIEEPRISSKRAAPLSISFRDITPAKRIAARSRGVNTGGPGSLPPPIFLRSYRYADPRHSDSSVNSGTR